MIAAGALLGGLLSIALALSPAHFGLLNPGPMTAGHADLACTLCHEPAQGSVRQQLQAKIRWWAGLRKTPAVFGYMAPDSSDCAACHARPDDSHAIHRFAEPRFADAVKVVDAGSCLGCHREHSGRRVSSDGRFCAACHADLALKADPLEESHRRLVAGQRWATCLGCHDYHGNHARKAQRRLEDMLPVAAVEAYLAQGRDPYADAKINSARRIRP
jgi:hypothetical protein